MTCPCFPGTTPASTLQKYKPFPPLNLENRSWPTKTITKAPRWLSTDLRDGNQSLPDPMTVEEKKSYFLKLVELGYKEIEVAFPSASQIDFDFTRWAVANAPDDVAVQVLSPCREPLIRRTIDSLKGAKKAIVHIYLASSPLFRDVVFGISEQEYINLAVRSTQLVRQLTKDADNQTGWQFEFSPETFSDSSMSFVVRILEAVKDAWEPSRDLPIIFNLPATVEMSTPNVYADQIEFVHSHLSEREKCSISLHCHNDRGCAVAATELGVMAGADRVEGTLFGNGERTGNVDLVTLGLNLLTQGVDPKIDFSDLESIVDVVERFNKIPVHPRAPYGGSLVVCAFSGSHQDAIKKGFARRNAKVDEQDKPVHWQVPYLPLDPGDVGRTYEAVIRVNSQSGKGGAAWVILRYLELDLPRALQVAFSDIVQQEAEFKGCELKSSELVELFQQYYFLQANTKYKYDLVDYDVSSETKENRRFTGTMRIDDTMQTLEGVGNGPISSFLNAMHNYFGLTLEVESYSEHSIGKGSMTRAVSYLQITASYQGRTAKEWGVGIHEDVSQASMRAAVSVLNRLNSILR